MEQPVDERRRAPRLPITVPIELRNGTGITRDVSGLGLFFVAPFPFEAGEEISFLLRIPNSINVRCHGRVVRSNFDREAMSYGVAVTIHDFDVDDSEQDQSTEPHIVLRELRKHQS